MIIKTKFETKCNICKSKISQGEEISWRQTKPNIIICNSCMQSINFCKKEGIICNDKTSTIDYCAKCNH